MNSQDTVCVPVYGLQPLSGLYVCNMVFVFELEIDCSKTKTILPYQEVKSIVPGD